MDNKITNAVIEALTAHPAIDDVEADDERLIIHSSGNLVELRLVELPGECQTCHQPLAADGSCINDHCDPGMACCPGVGCPSCEPAETGTNPAEPGIVSV